MISNYVSNFGQSLRTSNPFPFLSVFFCFRCCFCVEFGVGARLFFLVEGPGTEVDMEMETVGDIGVCVYCWSDIGCSGSNSRSSFSNHLECPLEFPIRLVDGASTLLMLIYFLLFGTFRVERILLIQ
jgi:hypothetical protein